MQHMHLGQIQTDILIHPSMVPATVKDPVQIHIATSPTTNMVFSELFRGGGTNLGVKVKMMILYNRGLTDAELYQNNRVSKSRRLMYDVYYTTGGEAVYKYTGSDKWVNDWLEFIAPKLDVKPILLIHRNKPKNFDDYDYEFPIETYYYGDDIR